EVGREGRRVAAAEARVERERVVVNRGLEALREVGLEDVPRPDVLPRALYRPQVLGSRERGADPGHPAERMGPRTGSPDGAGGPSGRLRPRGRPGESVPNHSGPRLGSLRAPPEAFGKAG